MRAKRAQEASRATPEAEERPQERSREPKEPPRAPQEAARRPEEAPTAPQEDPRRAPGGRQKGTWEASGRPKAARTVRASILGPSKTRNLVKHKGF